MQELRIPGWSGVCDADGKKIIGLGNDVYQIGVAIVEGVETGAGRVTFADADANRRNDHDIAGIIDLFPSLRRGIVINPGEITDVKVPESVISRHWQMADYDSAKLRTALIEHFKPHIEDQLTDEDAREDVLVVHLRGVDALNEWAQEAWRPSPASYEFYRDAIARSGLEKLLVVTTPPENGRMHPFVDRLRSDYGADVQHGRILEDFSVLISCTNLILDFSTFGYTAALMNTNLEKVFISRFVDKKGRPLLRDIGSDVGFTMPAIEGCEVYVYDLPDFVLK